MNYKQFDDPEKFGEYKVVLKALRSKPLTATEINEKIKMRHSDVMYYVSQLRFKFLIEEKNIEGLYYYGLTKRGRKQ